MLTPSLHALPPPPPPWSFQNTSVGIFCLKFFKDNAWHFVMIDDRIACNDNAAGGPCFAKCRDKNELWVLMIEKVSFTLLSLTTETNKF